MRAGRQGHRSGAGAGGRGANWAAAGRWTPPRLQRCVSALLALVSSAGWSFAVCGERGVQSPQRVAGPLQVVLAAAWLAQPQSEGAGGRGNEGQGHLSGPIAAGRDMGRYNCPAGASKGSPSWPRIAVLRHLSESCAVQQAGARAVHSRWVGASTN